MGTVTRRDTVEAHPTSYDETHHSWASISSSYPMSNAYTDASSSTYAQVNWKTGSRAETYFYLRFDFSSIPEGAVIESVEARARGYVNTTSSSRVTARQMQLASGTTLKGSALTMSTSTSAQTFSNVGTWTRAELQTAGVRYYVKRGTSNTTSTYRIRAYGADMTVVYTWQETTYSVTVSNSTAVEVEADPAEVVAGGSSTVRASSLDGIAVMDNGTDVTALFSQREDDAYACEVVDVGSYGFALSGGYYVSQNRGIDKSAAVCRVDMVLPVAATVTFSFINYAEQGYDFGVFGNIDVPLTSSYYPAGSSGATISETSYRLACNTSARNTSQVQTLEYDVASGSHSIYVKYSKDDASADNDDTLQFRVSIVLAEPYTPPTYYAYDIEGIAEDHAIVVSSSSGPALYVKIGGSWVRVRSAFAKSGGSWSRVALDAAFRSGVNYRKG